VEEGGWWDHSVKKLRGKVLRKSSTSGSKSALSPRSPKSPRSPTSPGSPKSPKSFAVLDITGLSLEDLEQVEAKAKLGVGPVAVPLPALLPLSLSCSHLLLLSSLSFSLSFWCVSRYQLWHWANSRRARANPHQQRRVGTSALSLTSTSPDSLWPKLKLLRSLSPQYLFRSIAIGTATAHSAHRRGFRITTWCGMTTPPLGLTAFLVLQALDVLYLSPLVSLSLSLCLSVSVCLSFSLSVCVCLCVCVCLSVSL